MATRKRLPFPLFIVVLVIVVMLAGFACACLNDHPGQALDRGFIAVAEAPLPLLQAAFAMIAVLLARPVQLAQAPARARLQIFRL